MTDKTPALEALKACPFCGGEAEIERRGDMRQSMIYACTDCGCRLETGEQGRNHARWNTRAALQPVSAEPVGYTWQVYIDGAETDIKLSANKFNAGIMAVYHPTIAKKGMVPLYISPPDQSARIRELEAALVEAAIPLEAIRLVGQIPMGMSNEMWAGVLNATAAARKALNKESDPS